MKLIIQIPAFNEEATLAQTLRELPRKIEGFTSVETLVIDDGSTDRTAETARKSGATHIVQLTNQGLTAQRPADFLDRLSNRRGHETGSVSRGLD